MSDPEIPSGKLAALVVDRLIEAGLLRANKREPLAARIAAGGMKGDDWKLEIELAATKAPKP